MIASFHLVHYRDRRFVQSRRAARNVAGLRFWRPLGIGPDWGALPADFNRWTLARPDFKRWSFFGVWEDEAALEGFLAESALARKWREAAKEVWHVRLKPVRTQGTWRGLKPLEGLEPEELPQAPVAVLTRVEIRARKVPTFWLSMTRVAAADIRKAPGLLAGLAMVERPYFEAMTFTLWQSRDDAMNFAYKRPAHVGLTERSRSEKVASFFSAHFYPYRSEGTWYGRDPLSQSS